MRVLETANMGSSDVRRVRGGPRMVVAMNVGKSALAERVDAVLSFFHSTVGECQSLT